MASTGKFYPFNRYINDIALLMDGTHKIIPSKYILLKKLINSGTEIIVPGGDVESAPGISGPDIVAPRPQIWAWPKDVINYANSVFDTQEAQSLEEINYQEARAKILGFILEDASEANDQGGYYIGGDINFLSHDTYDGMLYSEIYIHVPNDAGQYRVRVNNTNQPQNERVLTDLEPYNSTDKTYSFQGVLIFYNIYKAGSNEPFACDIPLGVFILNNEKGEITSQELIIQTNELKGNGTAWSTRLCSKFVSSASINDSLPVKTGQSDYNTLTALLSEFGQAIKIMEKNISSREEDILTIKTYLDNFKHNQTVNVPYVAGDWWYVNGRPVRPVDELELLTSLGNQYAVSTNQNMAWPDNTSYTILNYITDKSLTKFLLQCAADNQSGRFEGIDGVLCLDLIHKVLTVECKTVDQTSKIFKSYNIELVAGNTITYVDDVIKIGKNG